MSQSWAALVLIRERVFVDIALAPDARLTDIPAIPYSLCKSLRESEVYRVAFEKEKELTDRALKLAEIGKSKSNWKFQGMLGLAAFVSGFFAGK